MKTTPLLTRGLAALCTTLRALGFASSAVWIENEADSDARLLSACGDAESGLRRASHVRRWERFGDDREEATAYARRCDEAAVAAQWLSSAVRAVNGYDDETEADCMARFALELLADEQARAVVEAAGKLVAINGSMLDVLRQMGPLLATVNARRVAIGEPVVAVDDDDAAKPCSGGAEGLASARSSLLGVLSGHATQRLDALKGKLDGIASRAAAASFPDDLLSMAAHVVRSSTVEDPSSRVFAHLTRELAWSRMCWRLLLADLVTARLYREQRGGQQAGVPAFVTMPPSTLIALERDASAALGGAREDVPLDVLVREALGEHAALDGGAPGTIPGPGCTLPGEGADAEPIVASGCAASEDDHRAAILDIIRNRQPVMDAEIFIVARGMFGARFDEGVYGAAWETLHDDKALGLSQNSSEAWELRATQAEPSSRAGRSPPGSRRPAAGSPRPLRGPVAASTRR